MEQSTNSESPWIRVDFGMSASLFDFFGVVGDRLLTVETLLTHFLFTFCPSGRSARVDAVQLRGVLHSAGDTFDIRVSNDAQYSPTAQACSTGLAVPGVGASEEYSIEAVCSSDTFGRFLFISLPGSGKTLKVCEVEVSGDAPLVDYVWEIDAQPSFTAHFKDFAGNSLMLLEIACADGLEFCGYKKQATIILASMTNGALGATETITEQGIAATDNIMKIRVTADSSGFTLSWQAFDSGGAVPTVREYFFEHRFTAGVQNFEKIEVEASGTNPTTPVVTRLVASGAGGSCLPAEIDAVLPSGTKIYGGGTLVSGAFVTSAGGYTKTMFETSITGEYTYTSYVSFAGAAEYSFYAECGENRIVFQDPPRLMGCEFGDVALSFSSGFLCVLYAPV